MLSKESGEQNKKSHQIEKYAKDVMIGQEPFAPLPENVDLFRRSFSVGYLKIVRFQVCEGD